MNAMTSIIENVLVMVLTIVTLVGGFYLLLLVLNAWLKIKSGSREHEGLSNLWASAMKETKKSSDDAEGPPNDRRL